MIFLQRLKYFLILIMGDTVKDMTAKFGKLDKFEGNDFRRWQKKMHFLLTTLKVVYVLSLAKELWDQIESKYMAEDASRKKFLVKESGKEMGKEIVGSSSLNMIEDGKNKNNNKNTKVKKRNNEGNKNGSNKKSKLTCWKCGKTGHFKRDCHVKKNNSGNTSGSGQGYKDLNPSQGLNFDFDVISFNHYVSHIFEICNVQDDAFAWWIDSGANCHADPRTFDEAMQSRDVAFWKEAINDEMDSIMENHTWILFDLPLGCKPLDYKWIFKRKLKVDGTIDKFKAILVIQDTREADVILGIRIQCEDKGISITQSYYIEKILKKFKCDDCYLVSTPLDPIIKLMPNTSRVTDQLEYSRAISCLMNAMTSTRPNIAYIVVKLIRYTSNHSTHHWHAIMRASKKQTCIADSTMEEEFVALVATDKEAKWLRNLIYEIPLWTKPISYIFIHCDSAATLAKAYCQIYNGKSRHLGVRHSKVHELIINGVISVDFG
ncbi:zinc finger, CCHC-type containing protein [Tanacetum coccineum]